MCNLFSAVRKLLNTLWHNTKYMYFSFECQKHSELNSLENLHVFFASCHITDVREVDVENRKHQYCWPTNKEEGYRRIPESTFSSDRLKTSTKAEAECCYTDIEKNPLWHRLNKRSGLQYIGCRLQELHLLNTIRITIRNNFCQNTSWLEKAF